MSRADKNSKAANLPILPVPAAFGRLFTGPGVNVGKLEKYAVPLLFLCFAASLSPWLYNFPLNDDWAYALAARGFVQTGRLALSDWGSSTQVMHVLAGALVSKIFGFSFGALRVLDVLTAAAGIFFFSRLLAELDTAPFERTLAALAVALSPLYLAAANSYMTEAPYFLWMSAALYFYVRALKNGDAAGPLLAAGACAAAAYLTRQLAAALPLAYTLELLRRGRPKARDLALVWALPAAAMAGYYAWFRLTQGQTWASENYVAGATLAHLSSPLKFLGDTLYRLLASAVETGLLLLPLGAGFAFSVRRFSAKACPREGRLAAAAPWLALAALGGFALFNGPLPYLENTLSRYGIGVLTVGGAALKPAGLFGSRFFWPAATAAGVLSAVLLVCSSGFTLRSGGPVLRFLFAAFGAQLALSMLGAKYFDRYLLPTFLPWFAIAAAYAARGVKFSRPAAAGALALCALLGWAGMKDYLAWNEAKWELAARPHYRLPADEIANGFDYEAWLSYERNMAYLKAMKPLKLIGEWEWKSINRYKAIVSFTPDPSLIIVDRQEYSTPLSSRKGVLYLLAAGRAAASR